MIRLSNRQAFYSKQGLTCIFGELPWYGAREVVELATCAPCFPTLVFDSPDPVLAESSDDGMASCAAKRTSRPRTTAVKITATSNRARFKFRWTRFKLERTIILTTFIFRHWLNHAIKKTLSYVQQSQCETIRTPISETLHINLRWNARNYSLEL